MYQHSIHFHDIYQYITDGKLPSSVKVQNCIRAEALNYVVINNFLFRIDMRKDLDKGNLFLLVILEKYEPIIFNMYHNSLLAGHQGPYRTAMTIRQKFLIHNLMNKVKRYIEACHMCLSSYPVLTHCSLWLRKWRHVSLCKHNGGSKGLLMPIGTSTGDTLLPWDELQPLLRKIYSHLTLNLWILEHLSQILLRA